MSVVALLGLALAVLMVARALRRVSVRRRSRRVSEEARIRALPNAVVLLQIAIAAGRTPRGAIEAIGGLTIDGDLGLVAEDFGCVAKRLAMGAALSEAILTPARQDVSVSMTRVLDLLRRAELDGAALSVQLELLVRDFRTTRALSLDAAAQRMTVSMLFPLVLCILPAFILLAIVPLLLGAVSGLPG
jgi:pilus assembly protein TadC